MQSRKLSPSESLGWVDNTKLLRQMNISTKELWRGVYTKTKVNKILLFWEEGTKDMLLWCTTSLHLSSINFYKCKLCRLYCRHLYMSNMMVEVSCSFVPVMVIFLYRRLNGMLLPVRTTCSICGSVTSKTMDCINWKLMWVCWTPWLSWCFKH